MTLKITVFILLISLLLTSWTLASPSGESDGQLHLDDNDSSIGAESQESIQVENDVDDEEPAQWTPEQRNLWEYMLKNDELIAYEEIISTFYRPPLFTQLSAHFDSLDPTMLPEFVDEQFDDVLQRKERAFTRLIPHEKRGTYYDKKYDHIDRQLVELESFISNYHDIAMNEQEREVYQLIAETEIRIETINAAIIGLPPNSDELGNLETELKQMNRRLVTLNDQVSSLDRRMMMNHEWFNKIRNELLSAKEDTKEEQVQYIRETFGPLKESDLWEIARKIDSFYGRGNRS